MAGSSAKIQRMWLNIAVACLLITPATAFQSSFSPFWVQPIRTSLIADRAPAQLVLPKHSGHVLLGKSQGNRPKSARLRMSLEEADLPPESILTAVQELGGRVTVSDVATQSGTSMTEAKRHLTAMARQVGDLQVSPHGDLVYVFRKTFRADLSLTSRKLRLQQGFRNLKPRLQHMVRVMFGFSLFASVTLIWTSIFILLKSREDEDVWRAAGGSPNAVVSLGWILPADPLYWIAYDSHTPRKLQAKENHSFVEAVFSFVFGDGDPNWNLEERRRIAVSQLARKQHGILLPEQLAPFLDMPEGALLGHRSEIDHRHLLSLLSDLGGRPEVTDSGEIVYVFEELLTSASADQIAQRPWHQLLVDAVKKGIPFEKMASKTDLALSLAEKETETARTAEYLQEKEQELSRIGLWQTIGVWALAYANWMGGLLLGAMLRSAEAAGQTLTGIPLVAKTVYPFLVAFGLSMMVIPMIRAVVIKFDNAKIRKRNHARARIAALNALNKDELDLKLLEAKEFRHNLRVVSARDVEYTSGESIQA